MKVTMLWKLSEKRHAMSWTLSLFWFWYFKYYFLYNVFIYFIGFSYLKEWVIIIKRIFLVDTNNTQLGHLITSGDVVSELFVYCIVPPLLNTFHAIMPGEWVERREWITRKKNGDCWPSLLSLFPTAVL